MNKEKKQQLIMGVLMVLTVLFLGSNAVVKPAREKLGKARKVVHELEPKVRNGERMVAVDARTSQDLQKRAREILAIESAHLPPQESRFTWALQKITDITHEMGLEAKVEELRNPRFRPATKSFASIAGNIPMWVPYAVDVRLTAGYEDVKTLAARIQKENPYASVSQMGIYAGGTDVEKHTVTLVVEWPTFRDRSDLNMLRKLAGDS